MNIEHTPTLFVLDVYMQLKISNRHRFVVQQQTSSHNMSTHMILYEYTTSSQNQIVEIYNLL